MCLKDWEDREAFLNDHTLELNGYDADFDQLEFGLLYFTHRVAGCYSTMAIEAREFFSLYQGAKYAENLMGSDQCTGKCLKTGDLGACPAHCRFAFVREVVQIIKKRQHSRPDSGLHRILLDGGCYKESEKIEEGYGNK